MTIHRTKLIVHWRFAFAHKSHKSMEFFTSPSYVPLATNGEKNNQVDCNGLCRICISESTTLRRFYSEPLLGDVWWWRVARRSCFFFRFSFEGLVGTCWVLILHLNFGRAPSAASVREMYSQRGAAVPSLWRAAVQMFHNGKRVSSLRLSFWVLMFEINTNIWADR